MRILLPFKKVSRNAIEKYTVFISHSSKEKYFVALIARLLRENGIITYIDHDFLSAGDDFEARIFDSIRNSSHLIVIWSSAAASSEWVEKEINFAHQHKKEIIPCVIDDTILQGHLERLHYSDFRTDISAGLAQLFNALSLTLNDNHFVGEYANIILEHAIDCRLNPDSARDMVIPGVYFKKYEGKIIRVRDKAYEAIMELQSPDKEFLQTNYGGDSLVQILNNYLSANGWITSNTTGDGYDWQVRYSPQMAVASKEGTSFAYYSFADRVDGKWRWSIYFLKIDIDTFLFNVLRWLERDMPLFDFADNLYVERNMPAKILQFDHKLYFSHLTFKAKFGSGGKGLDLWDYIIQRFEEILGSEGYSIHDISIAPQPTFAVYTRKTIFSSQSEKYMKLAVSNSSGTVFQYFIEKERSENLDKGIAKISIVSEVRKQIGEFRLVDDETLAVSPELARDRVLARLSELLSETKNAEAIESIIRPSLNIKSECQNFFYGCLMHILAPDLIRWLPDSEYFRSSDRKSTVEIGGKIVDVKLTIWAERGNNATISGDYFSRDLFKELSNCLGSIGFDINLTLDDSKPFWTRKLFGVGRQGSNIFYLFFEEEGNERGSGYMKCRFCTSSN
jgi:TIR domain